MSDGLFPIICIYRTIIFGEYLIVEKISDSIASRNL